MPKLPKADKKSHVEIRVNGGSSLLLGQLMTERCQLIPAFSFKGTIFPEHDHEESAEVMVVISGKMKIIYLDKDNEIIESGEAVLIPKGVRHAVEYLEDTRMWTILCPPDKDIAKLMDEKK